MHISGNARVGQINGTNTAPQTFAMPTPVGGGIDELRAQITQSIEHIQQLAQQHRQIIDAADAVTAQLEGLAQSSSRSEPAAAVEMVQQTRQAAEQRQHHLLAAMEQLDTYRSSL